MLDLNLIPDGGISWLDASGPEGRIVLSTRVRLARNIRARPFPPHSGRADRLGVLDQIIEASQRVSELAHNSVISLDGLDSVDRMLLHERHLISRELVGNDNESVRPGSALITNGAVGLMVNEEDHLRLQALTSGFSLPEAFQAVDRLDRALGEQVPFAFHQEFGFLTSCPTNAGTGLRASVLIHLPGLVLTKEIGKVLQGLSQVGLTFRGLYGEGSEVVGNFFQLSNQTTLGKSEDELLDHLETMVRKVIEYEEEARHILQRDAPMVLADKVWRAYGLLRHARQLSFDETMNLLSGVRLGVGLNLISDLSVYTLNKLLVFTQPAHLAIKDAGDVGDPELSVVRASYVRHLLADAA